MTISVPVMMGIASPTGSHLTALSAEVAKLAPGSLVIEHGAGMYSTPLFLRHDLEVLCIEEHLGWAEWARWMYGTRGKVEESWKRVAPRLKDAALVFIDGEARGRGPLLKLCLESRVPVIVAHDTEELHWNLYRHQRHYFSPPGYTVTHDAEPHRTTVWRLG